LYVFLFVRFYSVVLNQDVKRFKFGDRGCVVINVVTGIITGQAVTCRIQKDSSAED